MSSKVKVTIGRRLAMEIGALAISMILERTSRGIDKDGKPFEPYSAKTFAMPLGAFLELTTKRQKKKLNKEGDLKIFRSKKSGNRWVAIDGGYLNFKKAWGGKKANTVNLQWRGLSGGMLGDLSTVGYTDKEVVIGFRSAEMAKLASYHVLTGAGKSRVIRDFMGLTPDDLNEIADLIKERIEVEF